MTFERAIAQIHNHKEIGLRVILAQGCFDILHVGHIQYLQLAKKQGDVLFVGIENDQSIKLNKGETRPVNNQQRRASLLAELRCIDYVFVFEDVISYGDLSSQKKCIDRYNKLSPDAVAFTNFDPNIDLKKYQSEAAGVGFVVIQHEEKKESSTRLLQLVGYE